ncbi:MAG: hypothetical protein R3F54_02715 [Alphaproteobacteria bacterium]
MSKPLRTPSPIRSLSARLLLLTMAFVLLGEILIYVPSISRFRKVYLEERIASGHLATLSLEASAEGQVDGDLESELLSHAGVISVTLHAPRHPDARPPAAGRARSICAPQHPGR